MFAILIVLINVVEIEKIANSAILRTAFFEKNISSLKKFYDEFGVRFYPVVVNNQKHWVSQNASFSLVEESELPPVVPVVSGFFLYKKNCLDSIDFNLSRTFNKFQYSEGCVSSRDYEYLKKKEPSGWVSVLRTAQVKETREFYNHLGSWVPEKHGNGPDHFSLTFAGSVFEIYPLRSDLPEETIDLVVSRGDLPSSFAYNSTRNFKDPSGRRILVLN